MFSEERGFRLPTEAKLGTISQVMKCTLTKTQELGVLWCRENRSVAATSDGFLVVCVDRGLLCIYNRQLNGEYKKETSISLSKRVTTERPICIAVSTDCNLLVARKQCLEIYTPTGQYKGTFDFKPGPSRVKLARESVSIFDHVGS